VASESGSVRGVLSVLSAPFSVSGDLVLEDVARQVEAAVAFGIAGVCLPAYGTEFYKLTDDERVAVVRTAAEASNGRIPVFGQANHDASRHAADLARKLRDVGADHISFAVPRRFAIPETDLLDYAAEVCAAAQLPVLVQDFNPGGATVGADFCRSLRDRCSNFRYIKLEEPLLGPKLRAIKGFCGDELMVFEGWGGMYLPELIGSGIDGVMPGLGHADAMHAMWLAGQADDLSGVLDIFDRLLPQIAFSLQNLELYLYAEKQLLASRGVISNAFVRSMTATPDAETSAHAKILNDRVLYLIDDLGLPLHPLA
jgi:2-keto-3-deoxy-L-arabinonate dehydratase